MNNNKTIVVFHQVINLNHSFLFVQTLGVTIKKAIEFIRLCKEQYTLTNNYRHFDDGEFKLFYILFPHILISNELGDISIEKFNWKSKIHQLLMFNLICDIYLYTDCREILILDEAQRILMKEIMIRQKYNIRILNKQTALAQIKMPFIKYIYTRSCYDKLILALRYKKTNRIDLLKHKWVRIIIKKIRRFKFTKNIKTRIYFKTNIKSLIIVQKFIKKWLIRKRLWKEIGQNKWNLFERMKRNMRILNNNSYYDAENKIMYILTDHTINMKMFKLSKTYFENIKEVNQEEVETIRKHLIDGKVLDRKWDGMERPVYTLIATILKSRPAFNTIGLHYINIGRQPKFFRKSKGMYDKQVVWKEVDMFIERMKARFHLVTTHNKIMESCSFRIKKTKFPMCMKGSIYSRITYGLRSGDTHKLSGYSDLSGVPVQLLYKSFWIKFGSKHNQGRQYCLNPVYNIGSFRPFYKRDGKKIHYIPPESESDWIYELYDGDISTYDVRKFNKI